MKLSSRTSFVYLVSIVTLDACLCEVPIQKQFVVPSLNKEEECKLEDLVPLRGPALHTLLKGLASLLVQLYPEICPKCVKPKKEKEEPIKIFRQIMQIPGPVYPVQAQPCYPTTVCKPPLPSPHQQQAQSACCAPQMPLSNQFYGCTSSPTRFFPTNQCSCQPSMGQQNQFMPNSCCCC